MECAYGTLVLRDMGYFCLSEFIEIESQQASWLTRLPLTTGVILEYAKALQIRLRSRRQDILDLTIRVGDVKKKCRLIAVQADKKIACKRRTQRRQRAKKNGTKPCPKGLVRDGWHLMLTDQSHRSSEPHKSTGETLHSTRGG